ncbi:MAG: carboxypeptidase-like regulatory domain-containing protein, partial [Bacteroidota bacterium]
MSLKTKLFLVGALLANIQLFAQQIGTVTGTVTDANSVPIPGANVIVLNTNRGVQTDFDGNYSIQVSSGEVLRFSYIGYAPQTVLVEAQQTIDIVLREDTEKLDEVVVIGYGTQKKSLLTGAISKVVNEDLDQISVSRIDEALIGQAAGVNIQNTEGEAGGAPTIRIRGVGSITSNSGPLVVLDGAVVDSDFLTNLDMNNVESFEVLKDAASAA